MSIKHLQYDLCSNRFNSHSCGEEIEFSFLLNHFSMISPQGNRSILPKPSGETVENSFLRDEKSISSPRR